MRRPARCDPTSREGADAPRTPMVQVARGKSPRRRERPLHDRDPIPSSTSLPPGGPQNTRTGGPPNTRNSTYSWFDQL
jgi:hypothetical protein